MEMSTKITRHEQKIKSISMKKQKTYELNRQVFITVVTINLCNDSTVKYIVY